MKAEVKVIGVTPAQANKQRWLNTFAKATFYSFIYRIGNSLKMAGKDNTGQELKKARKEYRNLIKYLKSANIEFIITVSQDDRIASTVEAPKLSINNQTENK